MHTKLKLISTVCAAAVFCSPAMADEDKVTMDLSGWDADSDRMLSLEEWDAAIEKNELFEKLDDNNNGIFDIGESLDNFLDYDVAMDLDDGGHIERQEFTVALFDDLDMNSDDSLDENEFGKFSAKAEGAPLLGID